MNKIEEKGITLVALVLTILILLILASIGVTSGLSTINYTKFSQFKNELEILQTKVNELNQNNQINIGKELSKEQKNIFNIEEITNIIFNNKTEEEKQKIKTGFKYFDIDDIEKEFNLASIKREYVINIEYRYIIFYKGFEYKGITYYMINQMNGGIHNIEYKDKNSKTGTFEVITTNEYDRWKIEITNIKYDGYINNWDVKYKYSPVNDTNNIQDSEEWIKVNSLQFYVTEPGNYYIRVSHGEDINLTLEKEGESSEQYITIL